MGRRLLALGFRLASQYPNQVDAGHRPRGYLGVVLVTFGPLWGARSVQDCFTWNGARAPAEGGFLFVE